MHIILTANYSPWSSYSGGGQRSTHNLATALVKLGHEVDVVFTKTPFETIQPPPNLSYSLHWAWLPSLKSSQRASWSRNFTIFTVRYQVKRLLREDTIVHSNGEEGALVSSLSESYNFPFVLTPRYPNIPSAIKFPNTSLASSFWHISNTKYYLLGKAIRNADLCSATSDYTLEMLKAHYQMDHLLTSIIPNGVNEIFLQPKINQNFTNTLIYFGRLAYSKGVDTLIEAAAILKNDKNIELTLTIIGRGEVKEQLQSRAAALNIIESLIFKPWLSPADLVTMLDKSSFVVLPSREESFGNTMAEAMATGSPVISTTAGSVPEVIVDGESGILVPPNNPQLLAEAIQKLFNDHKLSKTLAGNAKERIKDNFTWLSVAKKFEQQYHKLL